MADATATKSAAVIDYTLAGGEIVQATRVDPPAPTPGDIVWVEEGKFTGCILNLLEVRRSDMTNGRPIYICKNEGFGGLVELADGRIEHAIRTRTVALYLTAAEWTARMDGAHIVGRAHARATDTRKSNSLLPLKRALRQESAVRAREREAQS